MSSIGIVNLDSRGFPLLASTRGRGFGGGVAEGVARGVDGAVVGGAVTGGVSLVGAGVEFPGAAGRVASAEPGGDVTAQADARTHAKLTAPSATTVCSRGAALDLTAIPANCRSLIRAVTALLRRVKLVRPPSGEASQPGPAQ